jgi:hypothetical protein
VASHHGDQCGGGGEPHSGGIWHVGRVSYLGAASGCGDADAGVAPASRLLHRLPICATHGSIPLPAGEPSSRSPASAPNQEVVTTNARVCNYCNL